MRQTTLNSDVKIEKKRMYQPKEQTPRLTGRKHFKENQQTLPSSPKNSIVLFPFKKNVSNLQNEIKRKSSIRVIEQPQGIYKHKHSNSANIYNIFNVIK